MVVILFVGLGGFAVGLVLHLIGRLVYLLIHRHRVIADNLIAPTPPPPYPN